MSSYDYHVYLRSSSSLLWSKDQSVLLLNLPSCHAKCLLLFRSLSAPEPTPASCLASQQVYCLFLFQSQHHHNNNVRSVFLVLQSSSAAAAVAAATPSSSFMMASQKVSCLFLFHSSTTTTISSSISCSNKGQQHESKEACFRSMLSMTCVPCCLLRSCCKSSPSPSKCNYIIMDDGWCLMRRVYYKNNYTDHLFQHGLQTRKDGPSQEVFWAITNSQCLFCIESTLFHEK